MTASPAQRKIVIVGATGGIGCALADQAAAGGAEVIRLSRPAINVDDEGTIAAAADAAGWGLSHVIVASGLLHRGANGPERDWRQISADWMLESFKANAVLPALVAKHFLPRLNKDAPALFAVLTARVGSIGDNRLGGWHSYRASKAAANQLVRTLSVELGRKNPGATIVALHPGTVDTGMSRPFQRNVAPEKLFTPDTSAAHLWAVMDWIGPAQNGSFLAWDGGEIPW